LYRKSEGRCSRLHSAHTWIGLLPDLPEGCRVDVASFAPGDVLLLYPDGVTETRDQKGEMFGLDRLEALVEERFDVSGPSPRLHLRPAPGAPARRATRFV